MARCAPRIINMTRSIPCFQFHHYISFGLSVAVVLLDRGNSRDDDIDVKINLNAHFYVQPLKELFNL